MKKAGAVMLGFILLMSASPAFPIGRGEVDVEVITDSGQVLRTIPHRDNHAGETHIIKRYLEAHKGEVYSILVRNHLPERIGLVIAVDGRNIISGKKSFLRNTERMYIVDPYGETRLEGWRTDHDTVHRFFFTEPADSYSMRTFGDASAMGVIAVAVYRERQRPAPLREQERTLNQAPAYPAAPKGESKMHRSDEAGTGFGNRQYSPVVRVEFEPESYPFRKVLLRYEWRETLCKKGILACGQDRRNRLWDDSGYAPYPPAY